MHWSGAIDWTGAAALLTIVFAALGALYRHDRRAERLSWKVGQLADSFRELTAALRTYMDRTDRVLHHHDTRLALLEAERKRREKGN